MQRLSLIHILCRRRQDDEFRLAAREYHRIRRASVRRHALGQDDRVHDRGPVSYTHLDVYKRQVLPNGKNVTKPRSRAPLAAAVLLALTVLSVKVTGFDLSLIHIFPHRVVGAL